jgi:hypothetical protein
MALIASGVGTENGRLPGWILGSLKLANPPKSSQAMAKGCRMRGSATQEASGTVGFWEIAGEVNCAGGYCVPAGNESGRLQLYMTYII